MSLPVLLIADSQAEFDNTKAIWEAMAEKPLLQGQPEYLCASILAYQKYLLIQRCNAAFVNMLLDYASTPTLDYIVALLGVIRTTPQKATCTLRFNLVVGHGYVEIPKGTRVSSTDGLAVFETDYGFSIDEGIDEIEVNATCQTDGIIGNGYAIGTISTIMDVQPWISTCSNLDITANGVNAETDEELRSRAKLAPSSFSVAGPKEAYLYHTKSVSPLICDVAIITATEDESVTPGEVDIYPLLDDGDVPDESLIALIQSTLSSDLIRPMTDTVVVSAPLRVNFSIDVQITKLSSYSEPNSVITDAVTALLFKYKIDKYSKLGIDIVASEIESVCRVAGVYDLSITIVPPFGRTLTGRNLVLNANEFGMAQYITVTVTGENNG